MKKYLIIVLGLTTGLLKAQDFHLSQFDAAPQFLNPALTGMNIYDVKLRLNANYRSQWRSVLNNKPFTTAMIGGDSHTKRFGYGGYVINNMVGSGKLNSLAVQLSGAYEITNDATGKHNLSVGLNAGILQRSLNMNDLTFDAQYTYNSGTFNTGIASGESFTNNNVLKFDAGLGLNYLYHDKANKFDAFGGFALYHATKPNMSFSADKYQLPMRLVFHGGVNYGIGESITLSPNFLFMQQAKATDIHPGLLIDYKLNKDFKIMAGGSYRLKDAFVAHFGIKHLSNIYRVSYDLNSSYLKQYTGGKGALEFSVLYHFMNAKMTSKF
ncbi:MAG: PorP/SprF family type IX secretion system membrane protein [Bacteroidota bacterium]